MFQGENKNTIGTDEVGTGDFFGPIVVCGVYLTSSEHFFWQNSGVKDSKILSQSSIYKIASLAIKKLPYYCYVLRPKVYNNLIKRCNLNQIKALLHNEVILKMLTKIKKIDFVVLDQFTSVKNYFAYLKDRTKVHKDIQFTTKAESKYLSVALASIISRYVFLEEIKKLRKDIKFPLKLGAGSLVDQQIQQLYQEKGLSIFFNIAKCNFKNFQKNIKMNKK
ncbi:MAG: ribonuclease HIII [Vigna little leaf phytoplasma]|nr:ribonuclease HIII [Vigna little leaf phytoplasma]